MKYIKLTQGKRVIVDNQDFDKFSQFKWHYHKSNNCPGYARRAIYPNGKQKILWLHREILNAPKELEGDHINRNKLDCRRKNLRLCTREQNVRNSSKRKDSPNKYKGVHFVKLRNKWIARIQVNGKRIHSGYFNTEIEAAKRYDELALKHHGSFANMNRS